LTSEISRYTRERISDIKIKEPATSDIKIKEPAISDIKIKEPATSDIKIKGPAPIKTAISDASFRSLNYLQH
jgi:hypothetical protein